MPVTTIRLRFLTRAEALAALAPFGLVVDDPETGTATFAALAHSGGDRVDLDVLGGGSGRLWQEATTEGGDPEPRPGFHLNLRWLGSEVPDFGDAVVEPRVFACDFAD